ncbi:LLM class flavin-dependent oxidoreductase [Streptomyces sp. A012304]|uniref:LLM class flavin-dependent oxidoreductase n=1 Tax=Streptomyces sp. A012304 TaxID=375446 RepID=UPI00222E8B88|nr:LLM class flavin-dependent oxidoreductase [Streptomyces sp. A012304]GKQ41766.1 hypothetical protein ALMP_82790 [Streptomyces sp. A012304]
MTESRIEAAALVAAAGATERPRLGMFVIDAGFWNPALLAREVATTDALTDGRLGLGLGTGYVRAEHDTAGPPRGTPGERVDRLRRTVEELGRLLEADGRRVPLLIGANGDRMLELTVAQALELPLLLVGTPKEIVARVLAQRERYGFTYLTVLEPYMEAFAPVPARLRGR